MGDWIKLPTGYINLDTLISVKGDGSKLVDVNGDPRPISSREDGVGLLAALEARCSERDK